VQVTECLERLAWPSLSCFWKSQRTREGLQGSCSFLLQLFSEVIGEKEVVDIPLIAKRALAVGTDRSVEMILDL
jgi:hypothetical protein